MNENARCTEPPTKSNARGAQNAPPRRCGLPRAGRGVVRPGHRPAALGRARSTPTCSPPGTLAPQTFGEESWKWLFLQPLTKIQSDRRATPTTRHDQPNPTFRLVLLGVLVVVLLVVRRRAGLAARRPSRRGRATSSREREEVMAQTEQFVLRLDTYGPDQLDDAGPRCRSTASR